MLSIDDFLDRPWIERALKPAKTQRNKALGQPESPKSHQDLLREYSDEHETDRRSTMTLIMGECDYLLPFIECLNCVFNPDIPAVGEVWQVLSARENGSWQWIWNHWGRYTLSFEASKQREELSRLKRTLGASVDTATESTSSSSRHLTSLVSPPSSVGSNRQRSPSSTQSDAVRKRALIEEVSGDPEGL